MIIILSYSFIPNDYVKNGYIQVCTLILYARWKITEASACKEIFNKTKENLRSKYSSNSFLSLKKIIKKGHIMFMTGITCIIKHNVFKRCHSVSAKYNEFIRGKEFKNFRETNLQRFLNDL